MPRYAKVSTKSSLEITFRCKNTLMPVKLCYIWHLSYNQNSFFCAWRYNLKCVQIQHCFTPFFVWSSQVNVNKKHSTENDQVQRPDWKFVEKAADIQTFVRTFRRHGELLLKTILKKNIAIWSGSLVAKFEENRGGPRQPQRVSNPTFKQLF